MNPSKAFMVAITLTACGGNDNPSLEEQVAQLNEQVAQLQGDLSEAEQQNLNMSRLQEAAARTYDNLTARCDSGRGGTFTLSEAEVVELESGWQTAVGEGRWLPSEGGYRVIGIGRGSLLSSCGVKNGDIVVGLMGERFPVMADDIIESAKAAGALTVQLQRRGESVELVIGPEL